MKFRVEYINDSGAGKPVYSDRALKEIGINPTLWKEFLTQSRNPMLFETGNGQIKAGLSLAITSQLLGRTEGYHLDDAPLCMPMGEIVQRQKMAFIWIPGLLPFHVTNLKKLKITVPQKFRKYALRVEGNVPIFEEEFTISFFEDTTNAHAPIRIAPEVVADDAVVEDVADVPLQDPEGVQEADITLNYRKMSQRALIAEASSKEHQKTHYPHNPYCDICVEANQTQMRFVRTGDRRDDMLDAVIAPLKMISSDHLVICRAKADSDNPDADIAILTIRDSFSVITMCYP